MRRLSLILALLTAAGVAPASAVGAQCEPRGTNYSRVTADQRYRPLPSELTILTSAYDGVTSIQVGVIRPDVPDGTRVPVVLLASPYFVGKLTGDLTPCMRSLTTNLVPQGYAVAFVPVRGTSDHGACNDLMGRAERSDLDQAVTWLGTQPWSSGSIGMIGVSYDGSTPWEVASTGNPFLKTIVPISGVIDVYALMFGGGVTEWRGPILHTSYQTSEGGDIEVSPSGAQELARGTVCRDILVRGQAASAHSAATGERDPLGFWAERNLAPGVLANYRGSVLLVQGMQDGNVDPEHTLPFAERVAANGNEVAFMLGQWAHAAPDSPSATSRRGDWGDLLLAWFDRYLRGDVDAPAMTGAQIQDGTMRWRHDASWPPADVITRTYTLGSDGRLDGADARGDRPVGPPMRIYPVAAGAVTTSPVPTCDLIACFRMTLADTLHLTHVPVVRARFTPAGPSGQITAMLHAVRDGVATVIGAGTADLRFPNGGEIATPVTPGAPIEARIMLEPLDHPVAAGTELILTLTHSSHTDHLTDHPVPVMVQTGASARLILPTTDPAPSAFFSPRTIG